MRMITAVPVLLLAGCATDHAPGKPPLSEQVAQRILTACNARPGKLLRAQGQPPSLSVTISAPEQAAGGVAPTMTCVYDRLQPFRYGYIQIVNPMVTPD